MHRHPIDAVSLIAGAAFAAIGVTYLLPGIAVRDLWAPQLWPVLLVVLGAWLIASTVRRSRRAQDALGGAAAPAEADGDHDGAEDDETADLGDDEASPSSPSRRDE